MSIEYIVSSVVCTLLAVFLTGFAILNLFGERLGRVGRRMIFEMDVVMGGLLGIPRFSKVEGSILTFGAIGCYLSWSSDEVHQLLTVLALFTGVVYMAVCSAYAVTARQPMAGYVSFGVGMAAMGVWRTLRMMSTEWSFVVALFVGVAVVSCVSAALQMRRRAAMLGPQIEKLAAVQAFVEANENWDWPAGQDAPVGFSTGEGS